MPCSAKFSMTLQTEILSTETLDFLKHIFFHKSYNSVFNVNFRKMEQDYNAVMHLKDTNGMAGSVDPYMSAHLGAVLS